MIKKLGTAHVVFAFVLPFIIFLPFLILFSSRVRWQFWALKIHRWWAWCFFRLLTIPVEIDWRFRPKRKEQYIFCANHFSYFDIPAMGLLNVPFKFIGKASLAKVPVFGFMYRNIHITVDRSNVMSRVQSQREVLEAIDQGFNITYFPEGGMFSTNPPKMVAFKDGAFKVAVEKRVPIVPVTLCTNYRLFPDDPRLHFYWGKFKMIVHERISPKGEGEEAINNLRKEVRRVIESGFDNLSN